MSNQIELKTSNKRTQISYTKNGENITFDVPVVIEQSSGEEYVTQADLFKAEQTQIAKKYNLTPNNLFEMLTLWAPVKSRTKGITQKFRFNKILFYIGKRIEKIYGYNGLSFDEMIACRAGPIPKHLKEDIVELEQKQLVNVHLERDQKKIPNSQQNWQKMMTPQGGACVVTLSSTGEKIAEQLWKDVDAEFGSELLNTIQKTKEQLIYLDTDALREKVHKDYPDMKKDYTENDNENDYRNNNSQEICS